jgi:hypothetical protein
MLKTPVVVGCRCAVGVSKTSGNKKDPVRNELSPCYSMVPGAGIEPARPLKPRDFKLHVVRFY